MAQRKTMDEATIRSIVAAEIENCGDGDTLLSAERAENIKVYLGNPYGDEQKDRSKVISSDASDSVEWMLPTFMRIFTSGEDVVEFEPEGQEDVEAAKQATEYVNFIWNRDNPGFLTLYSWFKDALISKNGFIKIWWDTTKKTKRERYTGLNDEAFAELVNNPDVTVSEHTKTTQEIEGQEATFHDVVLTRSIKGGRVRIEGVPPEEFLVSRDARTIGEARMVGHKRKRTISDLIESGFPRDKVMLLADDDGSVDTSTEALARNTVETPTGTVPFTNNEAMREVVITECYLKIDNDGDGIAEMRKITVGGSENVILSNDSWDAPTPFAGLTPIIMPHRLFGRSVVDTVKDLQRIKTVILRQYLDNLYLSNNQREEVVEANIIDDTEVTSSKPGQKIRVKQGQSIFPIVVPQIGQAALEGLNYIDQLRENRTGVSPRTQGLGSDDLHDTAQGEKMLMTAAMMKIDLIARVFAETGIKDAFRIILKLVTMYQDAPRTVRLTGKQFVTIDPTDWNADMDMRVTVGLTTGDKDQQMAHANMIGLAQEKALPLGFVSPENLKNTAEMLTNAAGQKGVDRFFTFPEGDQAKAPIQMQPQQKAGTDPQTLIALENIKNQGKAQVAQIAAGAKASTDQHLNVLEAQRHHLEHQDEMELEKARAAIDVLIAHINNVGKIASAQIAAKASTDQAVLASEEAKAA